MLETSKGRGVRADYRCISSADGERYVWEQQLEGTPFEGFLRGARIEVALRRERRRDRGRRSAESRRCAGMSRLGSPMMRRATGATLDEALDGIERALAEAG